MKFRDICDDDVEDVVSLWRACRLMRGWNNPHQDIQFVRDGETSTILVGELDDHVIASAMIGHDGHRVVLYYLAVCPEFQKRGFGKKIG